MNSVFGDDPFENGWASEPSTRAPAAPFSNASFSTSQFEPTPPFDPPISTSKSHPDISAKAPQQYKDLAGELCGHVTSVSELQSYVFAPLVAEHVISGFQASRIIDILYEQSLLPASDENNFYHVIALLAMEISESGSADFVTLQFKLNSMLPALPQNVVSLLSQTQDEPQVLRDHAPVPETVTEPLNDPLSHVDLLDQSVLSVDPNTTIPESLHVNDYPYITKYMQEIRDTFKPLVSGDDALTIKEIPEKEGLVFKHINYAISHELKLGMNGAAGVKKVVRRYSDFVWLLEYLLKKFPFRVIPGLPPKKFTGASPDSQFLQRRRRGLHRFLSQLVKHPVLRQEPIVVTFLTVPTDLTSWRKQARIDYSLEFKGQKISTNFINSIWPTVGEKFLVSWRNAEASIPRLIEIWTKLVLLVERYEKRQQQIAFDNGKFVEMLQKFSDLDDSLYPHKATDEADVISALNADDTSTINDSLLNISSFFNKTSSLLIDDSYTINTKTLEKFKNYLDYLYSLQELFERSKRLSVNTIPQLQQRIKENEARHEKLSQEDADIKGSELVKLRSSIVNDKQEMFQQLNKDWLIKSCCFEEYMMFQETQYLISEAWAEWCKGRSHFQGKFAAQYDSLDAEVSADMPFHR